MLFRNNYGVDLGSSSVKVYSFFRNKTYIEKNMVAYRGRRILAIGNEAYEMFEKSPSDISVYVGQKSKSAPEKKLKAVYRQIIKKICSCYKKKRNFQIIIIKTAECIAADKTYIHIDQCIKSKQ